MSISKMETLNLLQNKNENVSNSHIYIILSIIFQRFSKFIPQIIKVISKNIFKHSPDIAIKLNKNFNKEFDESNRLIDEKLKLDLKKFNYYD